jgi:hypothetical protein
VSGEPAQLCNHQIRTLSQPLAAGPDPRIMRIVASVDAMMQRGSADFLIERQRMARLRPAHPLRFSSLLFQPIELLVAPAPDWLLVAPAAHWRLKQQAIPRTALIPMAEHIRGAMGDAATAIVAQIAGRTTADAELISRVGRSLWPEAARILADAPIPETWEATGLGNMNYRPLAEIIAPILAEAATLDVLQAEAATGLLPPPREMIEAILGPVAQTNEAALPMMIAILLDRLPAAADLLPPAGNGSEATAIQAALSQAGDLLLRQLEQEDAIETRIAACTLADAGAAVNRIAALLRHLDSTNAKPPRRERVRAARKRLEAGCKARFASGLQDDLLAPLQPMGAALAPAAIPALEAAARGLRVLETEGRVVGSGATYDVLLGHVADAIKDTAMRDRLSWVDRLRLVEILSGPNAASVMLDKPE